MFPPTLGSIHPCLFSLTNQTVTVSWVQPRVLSHEQIATLASRLQGCVPCHVTVVSDHMCVTLMTGPLTDIGNGTLSLP